LESSQWAEPQAAPRPQTSAGEILPATWPRVALRPWSDNPIVVRDCLQESICRDGSAANWYSRYYWPGVVLGGMLMLATLTLYPHMGWAWMPLFWVALWGLGAKVKHRLGQKLAREHFGRTLEGLRSTPIDSQQLIDGWAQISYVPSVTQVPLLALGGLVVAATGHDWPLLMSECSLLLLLLPSRAYLYLLYLMAPCMKPRDARKALILRALYTLTCLLGPFLMLDVWTEGMVLIMALLLLVVSRRIAIDWDRRGPQPT
jgi:hypothetical protein